MATMPLSIPMRDIAMAQQKAVSAKVAYWDAAHVHHGTIAVAGSFRARKARARDHEFDKMMNSLAHLQQKIVDWLARIELESMSETDVAKLVADLSNGVALTNSLIDEVELGLCEHCLIECTPILNKISDLNGHIDNHVESLRIAMDDTCSSLLAKLAREVTASATIA